MNAIRRRCSVVLIVAAASVGCSGTGLPSPRGDMATGQAMMDLNESLIQLREENAMIQAQVDSLRDVVARQDTVLRQVAAQAGLVLPPPG